MKKKKKRKDLYLTMKGEDMKVLAFFFFYWN